MAIEVKIYEQIRYLTEHEGLSQRKIAEQLRISRKTVKKYFEGRTAPWERKEGSGRSKAVLTDDVCKFVKACLDEDDELNLKKQHHTAKRIYDRLEEEKGFTGGESTIREYVAELKDKPKDVFVPLSPLNTVGGFSAFFLCDRRHNGQPQFSIRLQRVYIVIEKNDSHTVLL